VRSGCRLQDTGAVQGWSGGQPHVVADYRGGRESQLTWGGIREHEVFSGHEMRGPAGTGRGGVSMASVSIREVASEYLFSVLLCMNSYIFHHHVDQVACIGHAVSVCQ